MAAARPPLDESLWFYLVDLAVACVYGTVSGVLLARRPHPVAWILAVAGLGGALAAFGFAWEAQVGASGWPAVGLLMVLQGVAWVPGTLALFLVVPWLVRDHLLGGAWWGVAAGAVVAAAFTVVQLTGLEAPLPFVLLVVAVVAAGLVTTGEVTRRWRRGPAAERVGLGWLALGTGVMTLSFVPLLLPLVWPAVGLPVWATPVLHLVAQAFFPAAVLTSVLRQRMWGLDLAVSRAVLAGLLTLVLAAAYVVAAVLAARLLPGEGVAHVVAAAAVAALVQPSRLWLQQRVHRLVHGEAVDPVRVVRRLGGSLGRPGSPEDLLDGLVRDVVAAVRLESASVHATGRVLAAAGTPTGEPVRVPLEHRGAPLGELAVTAPPGEALDARTRRSLAELAPVIAAAVALARASADLDSARERLTSVRLEERRVIRRELHDGLGPSLAGLRLGLQGARNLVARDPAAADALLAALQGELDSRVDDVRQLSRSLLPPVLDELGLGPALDDLVERHGESGVEVVLRCTGADGLDQRTAAAAYGIVVEALMNVVRHSGARTCEVEVDVRAGGGAAGELRLAVADDGRGIDPRARTGVGTRSMAERAAEQGGSLVVRPRTPSGTVVEAVLPLSPAGAGAVAP
ncbi:sensor histidine kinase [Kineococcus sp. NUM-3379]